MKIKTLSLFFGLCIIGLGLGCGKGEEITEEEYPVTFAYSKVEHDTHKLFVVADGGNVKEIPNNTGIWGTQDAKDAITENKQNIEDYAKDDWNFELQLLSATKAIIKTKITSVDLTYKLEGEKLIVNDKDVSALVGEGFFWEKDKKRLQMLWRTAISTNRKTFPDATTTGITDVITLAKKMVIDWKLVKNDTLFLSYHHIIYSKK